LDLFHCPAFAGRLLLVQLRNPVAIRPGTTTLTVTPSMPTSEASVLDHPTSANLRLFEIARFGMGAMTPEEALVTMRPQPCSRMAGNSASVMAMTESTIDS
jgi:hypothetical protein